MQNFDLNLLILASSGVLLSFFLIGFDRVKYATAVDDPRIIHDLKTEHFILGIVHTFLGTIGLNHVKFFQWKILMNLKVYYLASLALHALTGLAWIVLASFTSSSENVSSAASNSKKKNQSNTATTTSGFNFASFVLNGSIITICMVALFVLSLVYIPIFSNLSNGTSIIASSQ